MLKSAYLHSPDGRKRTQKMSQLGKGSNAFDQLELGPVRTLLYGAISRACAEAATYPFEVVRKQLQLQSQATKMSAFAGIRIVERGGFLALYAGLVPSLLQACYYKILFIYYLLLHCFIEVKVSWYLKYGNRFLYKIGGSWPIVCYILFQMCCAQWL